MGNNEKGKNTFIDRRWHDDPEAEVIGHRELTDEEEQKSKEELNAIIAMVEQQKDEN